MTSTSSTPWKPAGCQAAVPCLQVPNCKSAIDFWKAAFGAEILYLHLMPDGVHVANSQIRVGEVVFMAMEPAPERGYPATVLETFLYSPDVDAAFEKAVAAGATPKTKPADRFWGDRVAEVMDPSGLRWTLATHLQDLTEAQIRENRVKERKEGEAQK